MSKFNIKLSDNTTYSEVGQINPLRWKVLYKDNNDFTDQSGWIKCKDFFNDSVAFFKENLKFNIYGYKNEIKKNEEGVYFLLRHIADKPSFFYNMDVVNEQLRKDFNVSVRYWDHDGTDVLILIPSIMWETTYRISMISMVIRLCNYGIPYKTWADMWDTHGPAYSQEHAFTEDAKKNAKTLGFKVPAKFEKYWWYCGPDHNSETVKKPEKSYIHNNGVSSWSLGMKQGA